MDAFLGFADSCKRLTDDDRTFLGKLVLEARRANSFLESSPTNLEDILSFSEMAERLKLTKDDENRNLRLREIIRKVYTTTQHPPSRYLDMYSALGGLIRAKPSEFQGALSFVTTNYDLNVECACFVLKAGANPGFVVKRVETKVDRESGKLYDPRGIPLYKLHGSVNWYTTNGKPGLQVEDRVVALLDPRAGNRESLLPYPCVQDYNPPEAPVIVPPSFLKPDLSRDLKDVWSGAAQVLSKASVVAFVGYSFPPSDTEMMFFLARALSENAGLRAVFLVDPKANEIAARLRAQGSRIGSHFRDLLRPINAPWTEVKLPL